MSKSELPEHISKETRRRLQWWCANYNEWKQELHHLDDTHPSVAHCSGGLHSVSTSSSVEKLIVRRGLLQDNIDMIWTTAELADARICTAIVIYVTSPELTFNHLCSIRNIECARSTFFEKVSLFYRYLNELKTEYSKGVGFRHRISNKKNIKKWNRRY